MKIRKRKMLGLLATGCLMFQFAGCSIGGLWNRAQIGFAERVGSFVAGAAIDILGLEDIAGNIRFGGGGGGGEGD